MPLLGCTPVKPGKAAIPSRYTQAAEVSLDGPCRCVKRSTDAMDAVTRDHAGQAIGAVR
jgi:hypothetical protein